MSADPSKPLPCAPDAERAILSLAMMDAPGVIARVKLSPSAFYDPAHKEIWRLIQTMNRDGDPVSLITLTIALRDSGRLKDIGGAASLAEIFSAGALPQELDYYAEILREKRTRREMVQVGERTTADALNESSPVHYCLELARTGIARLQTRDGAGSGASLTLADLDARRIKPESPPDKPVPIITLLDQQICTSGNLTVLSAQVKSGKSAAVGAIIAASLAADNASAEADTFGFAGRPTEGKAVIHFDTEQSPYDAWLLVSRACTRAGVQTMTPNFRAYSLCDIPTETRRDLLAQELERAAEECGGIHSVTIDGIADLVRDPNDALEAFGLVETIFRLAVRYACPIISVIHENPSVNASNKTRGHLGSELERKAESNLRLVKTAEISTIFSEKCRSASLPQSHGAKFKWCDHAGMHVSVEADTADQANENKRKAEQPACDAVFEGVVGAIKWGDLKAKIMDLARVTSATAERRIRLWETLGLIRKSKMGGYAKSGVSDDEPSTIMEPSNDHQ